MLALSKSRKTNCSLTKKSSHKERIQTYLISEPKTQIQGEDLQKYLTSQGISPFFNSLHEHLDEDMLVFEKKNTVLEDGVYILLEGQVTYVWVQHRYDRDRRQHLFAMAKNNSFSNLTNSPFEGQKNLLAGYSLSINKPFSIIEAELGNFMTNDDCCFIKLDERVLQLTYFHKIKEERYGLLEQCRLHHVISEQYELQEEKIFNLNASLHHAFTYRSIKFHNKFTVQTFGIVLEGVISSKLLKGNKIQLTKALALLPNFEYEVCSASATILEIQDNPTFYYQNCVAIEKIINENNQENIKKQRRKLQMSATTTFSNFSATNSYFFQKQGKEIEAYRSKISNSLVVGKYSQHQNIYSKASDIKKRKRQVNIVSKQCQNYCIIPMEFCKQNLKYAKDINKKNTPKEQKLKNPQILFSIAKKSHHKLKPISPFVLPREQNQKIEQNHDRTSSELMTRYQIFSKQMYQKFTVQHNRIKNQSCLSEQCNRKEAKPK